MNRLIGWLVTTIVVLCCAALAAVIIATPMSVRNQLVFGFVTIVLLFIVSRMREHTPRARMVMIVLTVISATRYMYWRVTETLVLEGFVSSFFSIGLLGAELYAWLVLVLSFFQSARPLERKMVPLPDDVSLWPTVDVYIPTYNESLDVVRDTVLAATNLDYPQDKLKIYLLDDGRRPEFGAFASAVGVGYITRNDNKHAKAGNLNNAMKLTNGELICVFDCDHITTRAFLQATVGAFLKDPNLALIQTPHHFYSPDPFERNLAGSEEVPHEGALFYGPVQKGNDYWNATFFCGSCAVIRRKALESTGGFAVETVTEDAHTALRLQRKGWSTAYLGLPLASGLATERLALHIIQRGRWCRGMTQILRVDNPLFGPGLTLPQRLCYLSAMLHFQFPIARFVFLTAPLAYLLFSLNIIEAAPQQVAAYVLPHLFCVVYTNSKLTGKFRYTFWNEIYETVLTFHLLKPSLLTLLDPTKGKFDVTHKGGLLKEGFIDFRVIQPHLFFIFLLIAGMVWGTIRVLVWEPAQISVLFFNLFWAFLSLIFLFAAIAVANERRQVRKSVRIELAVPVVLHLENGHTMRTTSFDISMGGIGLKRPENLMDPSMVESIELYYEDECMVFPVSYVDRKDGKRARQGSTMGFQFKHMSLEARRDLVRLVMGRPDAWLQDLPEGEDRPLHSLRIIFRAISGFFAADWKPNPAEPGVDGEGAIGITGTWRGRLLFLLLVVVGVMASLNAMAQTPATAAIEAVPPVAQADQAATTETAPTAAAVPPADSASDVNGNAAAPASVELQPLPALRTDATGRPAFAPESSANRRLSLVDMGQPGGLRLQGNGAQAGLPFSLRRDEVVSQAQLELDLTYSPELLDEVSYLDIVLNGVMVERVFLGRFNADGLVRVITIPPELIIVHNQLEFRLAGETRQLCSNILNPNIWVQLAPHTQLRMSVQKIPATRDLSMFPAPFVDEGDMDSIEVPVVLPGAPRMGALRAAMVTASYLGALADYRNVDFPLSTNRLPNSNAIVLVTQGDFVPDLQLPPINRPMLLQMAHPLNPLYQLLVIAGTDDRELQIAANYLALRGDSLSGNQVVAEPLPLPNLNAYEAPRWQHTGELVYLNQLAQDQMTQRDVRSPARRFSFKLPPDLYVWPGRKIKANLEYQFPDGDWIDKRKSRLEVMLNGEYLASLAADNFGPWYRFLQLIGRDSGTVTRSVRLNPELLYGNNEISFYFNMAIRERDDCNLNLPASINAGLMSSSHLDLTHANNFATLPDLSLFAAGTFPFTIRPDLNETVLMLPERPSLQQMHAALNIAGRIGGYTGHPVFGLEILMGLQVNEGLRGSDLLVISDLASLRGNELLRGSVFSVGQDGTLGLRSLDMMSTIKRWLRADWSTDVYLARTRLNENGRINGFFSFPSPVDPGRNVVVVAATDEAYLPAMISALKDEEVNAAIRGDLALFEDMSKVTSYSIGPREGRGVLPKHQELRWLLGQYVLPMVLAMLLISVLVGSIIYRSLERRAQRRMKRENNSYDE